MSIILVFSLVICLVSCNNIEENPEFEKFSNMVMNHSDSYQITITTTSPSGLVLVNEYKISTINGNTKIEYKVETLNEFSFDGDKINIPSGYKTVSEGVIEKIQDSPELSMYYNPTFNFSYTCIDSDIITPISFSAKITSLEKFMGVNISDISNAKFSLSYSGNSVKSIEVSYLTSNENSVVITYTFN